MIEAKLKLLKRPDGRDLLQSLVPEYLPSRNLVFLEGFFLRGSDDFKSAEEGLAFFKHYAPLKELREFMRIVPDNFSKNFYKNHLWTRNEFINCFLKCVDCYKSILSTWWQYWKRWWSPLKTKSWQKFVFYKKLLIDSRRLSVEERYPKTLTCSAFQLNTKNVLVIGPFKRQATVQLAVPNLRRSVVAAASNWFS